MNGRGINRIRIRIKRSKFPKNYDWIYDDGLFLRSPAVITEPNDEETEWTDQEILVCADGVLQDSLKNLADGRCSQATLNETLDWINSNDKQLPFSFINCCLLLEYDYEEIRDRVMQIYQRKLH